ncbi:MAG: FHA domain-containing protein, partial [Nanoarchaeota archaeon]|nr:FHA domain-containing protein [Nanoarchaeota archaeon]
IDFIIFNKADNYEETYGYVINAVRDEGVFIEGPQDIKNKLGACIIKRRADKYYLTSYSGVPRAPGEWYVKTAAGFKQGSDAVEVTPGTIFHLGPDADKSPVVFRFDMIDMPPEEQWQFSRVLVKVRGKAKAGEKMKLGVLYPEIPKEFDYKIKRKGFDIDKIVLYADELSGGEKGDIVVNVAGMNGAKAVVGPFTIKRENDRYYLTVRQPGVAPVKTELKENEELKLGHDIAKFRFKIEESVTEEWHSVEITISPRKVMVTPTTAPTPTGTVPAAHTTIGTLEPVDKAHTKFRQDNKDVDAIILSKGVIRVGKKNDMDIVIKAKPDYLTDIISDEQFYISTSHAGAYKITDISATELFVNNKKLAKNESLDLDHDAIIRIGRVNLEFRFRIVKEKTLPAIPEWKPCEVLYAQEPVKGANLAGVRM